MELLGMLLTGLVVGALARLVVPGTAGLGCLPTVAVGVGGAVLGGWLGQQLVGGTAQSGWWYLVFSVLGGVLILMLFKAISGRRR